MRRVGILAAVVMALLCIEARPARAVGLCSTYTSFSDGGTVTAAILNSSFTVAAVTNGTPSCVSGHSANATEMQSTRDPYPSASISLATSLKEELQGLRYAITAGFGWDFWYEHSDDVNRTVTWDTAAVNRCAYCATITDTNSHASSRLLDLRIVAGGAPVSKISVDKSGNLIIAGNATIAGSATISGALTSGGGVTLPRSYLAGLTVSNDSGDATNDLGIAVGAARDSTNIADIILASALIKQLDAAWAVGTNQGCIDTGAASDATWHIYVIKRLDTGVIDGLCSLSATAPTMPASYDYKRRLASVIRTGGANVAFTQRGDEFLRNVAVSEFNEAIPAATAQTKTLSVPTGVKVDAIFSLYVRGNDNSTQIAVLVTSPDQADTAASSTVFTVNTQLIAVDGDVGSGDTATVRVRTNALAQIRLRANVITSTPVWAGATHGWVDTRGRDD